MRDGLSVTGRSTRRSSRIRADHVRLVSVDFETDDLMESLAANGFQLDQPTMVVWEAVTQYLTEDGVRRTLALLGKAATGSRLVFTFVRRDFLDGTNSYQAEGAYRDFVVRHRVRPRPAGLGDRTVRPGHQALTRHRTGFRTAIVSSWRTASSTPSSVRIS